MKKVLLLIPGDSSFLLPIVRYFEQKKWQVSHYDYRKGSNFVRIFRFTPVIGGFEKAMQKIFEDILKTANNFKPDLILVIKGENLTPQFLKKLKVQNPKSTLVNWFPDPLNQWELMKTISPYYDYYFDSDPSVCRKLKKIGRKNVHYLTFASEFESNTNKKKKYDVAFVGTYSPFREKYLSSLKKFYLNIWGDPRWFKSSLRQFTRGGRIHQSKMKDIVKRSRININIHHNTPREGTNLRVFEITGSGGFLLSDYVKDLERIFKIGKEIETFKNSNELVKKVRFYLGNPFSAAKIAQKGYARAKRNHSYKERLAQMLKITRLS